MSKITKAWSKYNWALKCGNIVKPEFCEKCGKRSPNRSLDGHHNDYDKPLEVRWLCSRCHRHHHRDESVSNGTSHCSGRRTALKCDTCLKAHVLLGDRHGKFYIERQREEP